MAEGQTILPPKKARITGFSFSSQELTFYFWHWRGQKLFLFSIQLFKLLCSGRHHDDCMMLRLSTENMLIEIGHK